MRNGGGVPSDGAVGARDARPASAGAATRLTALIEVFSVYRTYAADTSCAAVESPGARQASRARRRPGARPDRPLAGRRRRRRSPRRGDPALRAALGARRGQGGRGHRLLSLWPAAFAQRRRLRPGPFLDDPAAFAERAAERGRAFPASLLATATHDHKRGEDVRARLAVLSEMPDAWAEHAKAWLTLAPLDGVDPGDAHMLHQMIVGAWPLDLSPTTPRR
jgi:(1->4)-alpha-D-glucan 1-alpha-D-glucosylmutase